MQTSDYITSLQNDKTNFANKLVEKGVEVTGNETFTELIPKLDEIQSGGKFSPPFVSFYGYSGETLNFENLDTSNVTNMSNMFAFCKNISYLDLNSFNTSNVTNMDNMFQMGNVSPYSVLTRINLSNFNTSNVTSMSNMFEDCRNLKYLDLSNFNTSNVKYMGTMFKYCRNLTTIAKLDASKVTSIRYMFDYCEELKNFGGLTNLGEAYLTTAAANYQFYKMEVSYSKKLTHESLMNIINNLYDIATKGCNVQQLILGSTNKAKLTAEEIEIATNKGWVVS